MKGRRGLSRVRAVMALALIAVPAPAYYHFVTYLNGVAIPEKFDLTALPNNTVTVFVSENGPQTYSQNDNLNSVLTQIGQATTVWNGIASSALRVAFGGLENSSTLQNTPGIDVTFEDLPPGVEGYGGPTSPALGSSNLSPVTAADGSQFIPIVRSSMHFNLNMTLLPGPSYNQTFYLTTLHELGHALGLQHTFTSATMSQATTRATTQAHPVAADDIAGLSVLYPNANFAQFGSITGQITAGGNGVHLASVVAIRSGGDAVSAVTNPDGTYRIDGIPPGSYYVYVHTMPPDADIFGPWDSTGTVVPASGPVNTLFYGGTPNLVPTAVVSVQKGVVSPGIDIATSAIGNVPIYDGQIYGYFNGSQTGITPANINMFGGAPSVNLAASVVTGANGLAPGLSAQAIGSSISVDQVYPYAANGFTYYGVQVAFNLGAQTGSQHVIFNTPSYTYVLPAAINLTQNAPPTVTAVSANGDGTLTVTGTNWASDTQIYFDGLPSTIVSLNPSAGSAVIVPPPGTNNEQAILTAYNSDGQNSQFVQSASPVTYSYGAAAIPLITSITPSSLPAGAEAAIDIVGSGFTLTPGQTIVGFGTSDVLVQQVFVLSPTHVRVNVLVSPNAALSNSDVSVIAGFQYATATAGFQIAPPVAGLPVPIPPLVNALPGLTGAYPGAIVSLYGSNLAAGSAIPVITVANQPVTVLYASPSQLNLQLPSALTPGPAILALNNGALAAFPIAVNIANLPAAIAAIQTTTGAYIDATSPAQQGQTLIVTLTNFAPPGTNIAASRVQVSVGGVSHPALSPIIAAGAYYQIYFSLNSNDPVGQSEQVVVYLDGNSSYPAAIPVTP